MPKVDRSVSPLAGPARHAHVRAPLGWPIRLILSAIAAGLFASSAHADDGYSLWLRYQLEPDQTLRSDYQAATAAISLPAQRPTLLAARSELERGLTGICGKTPANADGKAGTIYLGTPADGGAVSALVSSKTLADLGPDGFVLRAGEWHGRAAIVVAGNTDIGVLYGTFALLRRMQLGQPLRGLDIADAPRVRLRMADHWDNPIRGDVERGYAGYSIFKWYKPLGCIEPRYRDYARMLASLGLNGTVVNNVNTAKNGLQGWRLLTQPYLLKLAKLAGVLRPYGVRVYLSVNFSSPILLGALKTADPLDPAVQAWWRMKADEIYRLIPDFGGFLVKADSEGEPGPDKFDRTQAQGANALAQALAPHGGIVIWRTFVYTLHRDRLPQAYRDFEPFDGKFDRNVFLQIKNGPLDFQVREPVSPLLGAMPHTNQILELEVTQEYTGQNKHVCYLAPEWCQVLDFDTHARGTGSTVERLVSGRLYPDQLTGMAGVMNLGSDRNWTGAFLAQANTYAYGRLTWNPGLSPQQMAENWVRLTFGRNPRVVQTVTHILMASWRTYEDYTAPYGLGLLSAKGTHFDPAPAERTNYTHADATGVGFDRTVATGSGLAGQYFEPWRSQYESAKTCPDDLLLYFHHVPYTYRLHSGETLIQGIYDRHFAGVAHVREFVREWKSLHGLIDNERYAAVLAQLQNQVHLAEQWCRVVNGYFHQLSGIPDAHGRALPDCSNSKQP